MTLTQKLLENAACIAYYGDKALGIDYNLSLFPTYAGIKSAATNCARHSWKVARKEVINKKALKKGAKIGALSLLAYIALC